MKRNNVKKNHLKINKKVFYRVFTAFVAVIALTVATIAWFAHRSSSDSDGMQSGIRKPADLVVAINKTDLYNMTDLTAKNKVTLSASVESVKEATHDVAIATGSSILFAESTGMLFNETPDEVDEKTGLGGVSLKPVATNSVGRYYMDYSVFIAALPYDLPATRIIVGLDDTTAELDFQKAFTIDVYQRIEDGTIPAQETYEYRGKLAFSDLAGTVVLCPNGITVPENKSGKYIEVKLRCYMDGAANEGGKAYINSMDFARNPIKVSLKFDAQLQ